VKINFPSLTAGVATTFAAFVAAHVDADPTSASILPSVLFFVFIPIKLYDIFEI
jgi:hypothetical protein